MPASHSGISAIFHQRLFKGRQREESSWIEVELANALGALARQIWSGTFTRTAPLHFKAVFGKSAPQFSGAARQDIMEFLNFLLNGIHEDLKKVMLGIECSRITDLFQGQTKTKHVCGDCGATRTEDEPFMYLTLPIPTKNERRILVTLIASSAVKTVYGVKVSKNGTVQDVIDQVRSLAKCGSVKIFFMYDGKEWLMNEADEVQTIPREDQLFAYEVDSAGKMRGRDDGIPSNQHPSASEVPKDPAVTIYDCLDKFSSRESLAKGGWTCPECEKPANSATSKKQVEIFPEILVLSPDRFQTMDVFQDKITTSIDFPAVLEVASGDKYELVSYVCHRGEAQSGKYVAFAKCGEHHDQWYEFNDAEVKLSTGKRDENNNFEDVVAIFYKRMAAPAIEVTASSPKDSPRAPRLLRTMSRTASMGNVNQYAPPRSNLVVASPFIKRDQESGAPSLFQKHVKMLQEQAEQHEGEKTEETEKQKE